MIGDISGATSIYIITGRTDMRKSINGLCAIVYDMMGEEILVNIKEVNNVTEVIFFTFIFI